MVPVAKKKKPSRARRRRPPPRQPRTISAKLTPGTDYSVNVHKSKQDMAVISCGDLKGGGDQMQMPPRDTTAPKP